MSIILIHFKKRGMFVLTEFGLGPLMMIVFSTWSSGSWSSHYTQYWLYIINNEESNEGEWDHKEDANQRTLGGRVQGPLAPMPWLGPCSSEVWRTAYRWGEPAVGSYRRPPQPEARPAHIGAATQDRDTSELEDHVSTPPSWLLARL